jgi:hypothetical protein
MTIHVLTKYFSKRLGQIPLYFEGLMRKHLEVPLFFQDYFSTFALTTVYQDWTLDFSSFKNNARTLVGNLNLILYKI